MDRSTRTESTFINSTKKPVSYREIKRGKSNSKKIFSTIFVLIILISSYVILKNGNYIDADIINDLKDENTQTHNTIEDNKPVDITNNNPTSDISNNGEIFSSISFYEALEGLNYSIGKGYVQESVQIECDVDSIFEVVQTSSLILVEQQLTCEKEYNITNDYIDYTLKDTLYVSLLTDSGTYKWSNKWIHKLTEWNEDIFNHYKIPSYEYDFIEAKWSGYEKIEIRTAYSEKLSHSITGEYWKVTLDLKNSGTKIAVISQVFINDVPISGTDEYLPDEGNAVAIINEYLVLEPGDSQSVIIFIDGDYQRLSTGTTINVKLHTKGGMDYIKLIQLV